MEDAIEFGSQCVCGKTRYKSRAAAQAALEHLRERAEYYRMRAVSRGEPEPRVTGVRRVYRSASCRAWHLTSLKR